MLFPLSLRLSSCYILLSRYGRGPCIDGVHDELSAFQQSRENFFLEVERILFIVQNRRLDEVGLNEYRQCLWIKLSGSPNLPFSPFINVFERISHFPNCLSNLPRALGHLHVQVEPVDQGIDHRKAAM